MVKKDLRYIIRRILICFGIGVLFALFHGVFALNVHAEDNVFNRVPTSFSTIAYPNDTPNPAPISSYSVYGETFYGATYGGAIIRGRIMFGFTNIPTNKSYDLDFVVYITGSSTYLDSTRGYILNGDGNYSSCSIDNVRYASLGSPNSSTVGGSSGSADVHCSNVYIGSTNTMRFYLMDIITQSDGTIAISPVTFKLNVDSAMQQDIASIDDAISDQEVSSSTSSSINDVLTFGDNQTTYGPVADLILLPLTLFGAFYTSFGGSCSSYDLGTLFNHHLVLPCINLENVLGSSLYTIIDVAISLFMIYNIVMMCISMFDKITSLQDPFEEIFKPGGGN